MRRLRRRRRGSDALRADGGRARVLVISASMGAGHNGAAKELAARLGDSGHQADVRDFLDAAPLKIGSLVRRLYELELRYAPSAYDRTYQLWYRAPWLCPLVSWLVCLLTRRRVLRWVNRLDAQVVVSTYPLATLCLGRLRRLGRLKVPAVNFITDFGVHPLWVHRGMDLHLAVHDGPAAEAHRRTGRPAEACGPMVSDAFATGRPEARDGLRKELGLRPDDRAVLIVAGSLAVGDVDEMFDAVASSGDFVPVAVCGRDETTRARLQKRAESLQGRAVVIGWTDRMPALMVACDALVENAGGLTSLEALRAGLPVVSYQPIAGHGRENTSAMAAAGVSCLAADRAELVSALGRMTAPGPDRDGQVRAGHQMFAGDGAAFVLRTIEPEALAALEPPRRLRIVWARTSRTATVAVAAGALAWGGMTTGVGMATAFGAGVAHPAPGDTDVVYVGVRLDSSQLRDPAIRQEVQSLGVTVVVDAATAAGDPADLRRLEADGVDIENGGRGRWVSHVGHPAKPPLWTRADGDVDAGRALSALLGRPVRFFVPGRRLNAFDLLDAHRAHDSIVVPNTEVAVANPDHDPLARPRPKEIVLVNGLDAPDSELLAVLQELQRDLTTAHLTAFPIAALT